MQKLCFAVLMWFANCSSDPSMSIKPFLSWWKSSFLLPLIFHVLYYIPPLSTQGLLFFLLRLLTFALRDVLIISPQKYDFSLFYRAKNLIADSSIQLCFTGVENNKQGGRASLPDAQHEIIVQKISDAITGSNRW